MPEKSTKKAIPIQCPHCTRWLSRTSAQHRCVPPTERDVVGHLEGDLLDAWKKLRGKAMELGDQRLHASAKAVMFSRSVCYLFVRTRKASLELCLFLPHELAHPGVKRVQAVSKQKFAHTVLVQHEDQVEAPLTDWMRAAWEYAG